MDQINPEESSVDMNDAGHSVHFPRDLSYDHSVISMIYDLC